MSDQSEFWPPENYYRVAIKTLIFDDDNRLLICRDEQGRCLMPGGGWDHGETYDDCARRELAEELGAEVSSIDVTPLFYRCTTWNGHPKVAIAVLARLKNFSFTFNPEDEVTKADFVTKEEFERLTFQSDEAPVQQLADQIWRLVEKKGKNK